MNPRLIGMQNYSGLSADEEIPRRVIYDILPGLEEWLGTLGKIQRIWNAPRNAIPEKIVQAKAQGKSLGGYDPDDWARWGQTLVALNAFLATPITIQLADGTTEEVTPESVLLTRYTPVPDEV